jgi:hypothetical protein
MTKWHAIITPALSDKIVSQSLCLQTIGIHDKGSCTYFLQGTEA